MVGFSPLAHPQNSASCCNQTTASLGCANRTDEPSLTSASKNGLVSDIVPPRATTAQCDGKGTPTEDRIHRNIRARSVTGDGGLSASTQARPTAAAGFGAGTGQDATRGAEKCSPGCSPAT